MGAVFVCPDCWKGSGTSMSVDNERRERVIQHILAKRTSLGTGVGIGGAKVCQCCGEVRSFIGFVQAICSHVTVGDDKEFVCIGCHFKSPGRTATGFMVGKAVQYAREILESRPYRFCELCQIQVHGTPDSRFILPGGGKIWACAPCAGKLRDGLEDYSPKRRYLERKLKTDEQLRAYDIAQEANRLDIEETLDGRLKSQRPKRAAAALAELGKVHGENYGRSDGICPRSCEIIRQDENPGDQQKTTSRR